MWRTPDDGTSPVIRQDAVQTRCLIYPSEVLCLAKDEGGPLLPCRMTGWLFPNTLTGDPQPTTNNKKLDQARNKTILIYEDCFSVSKTKKKSRFAHSSHYHPSPLTHHQIFRYLLTAIQLPSVPRNIPATRSPATITPK